MRLAEGDWSWGLELQAYGYQGALVAPAAPTITSDANRVEYRRGSLTEWYVNDTRGVEQGFTVSTPPTSASAGAPLVVELGLSGDLAATLDADGDGLTLTGPGTTLRYDGLVAYDASGRDLPARMTLDTGTIALEVDDTGAAYPLTIDPLVSTEQAKLTASDAASADFLGRSVAISGDTAVVSSSYHTVGSNQYAGAAYVFVWDGSTWSEQAKLVASDAAGSDFFGDSVAISGETVLVGAYLDDTAAGANAGSAYVFVRDGGSWTEQAKLTAEDAEPADEFGKSVAIDGDTAIVGVPRDNASTGSAYVFERTVGGWVQEQRLTPPSGTSAFLFGTAVALSNDTIVVGADWSAGAAFVFVRDDLTWSYEATLTASDAVGGDSFGMAVAIDGDLAVIGAPLANPDEFSLGAAYAFVRTDGSWVEEAKLLPAGAGGSAFFGRAVAVSGDNALVGAFKADTIVSTQTGAAYLFTRTGASWAQTRELIASDGGTFDTFGFSVGLWEDTAVVGAEGDDTSAGGAAGSAYVFDLSAPPQLDLSLSIDDVSVVEGDTGKRTAQFTVSLSGPAVEPVSVRVATVNGSARASIDYVPRTVFLSFSPGQTTATFDVKVKGDTALEANETFTVRLDKAHGAAITDSIGIGTIINDD